MTVGKACRVVSWNIGFSGPRRAAIQGAFLRSLQPDLVLLQELNPDSSSVLHDNVGFEWLKHSTISSGLGLTPGRGRVAAVGGRGVGLLQDLPKPLGLPLPERVQAVRVAVGDVEFVATSYHAPPGASWVYWKVEQALVFLDWLNDIRVAAILGADANTPEIDHPNFAQTRSHWQSGSRRLGGLPGDQTGSSVIKRCDRPGIGRRQQRECHAHGSACLSLKLS